MSKPMSKDGILNLSSEQIRAVKHHFKRTDEDIAKDVCDIKNWLAKQPHLPQNEDDTWIEVMLILNKFSIEKTKNKLDMLYTVRTLAPLFYEDREPLNPRIQKVMNAVMVCPLPNLTEDLCRVHIFRLLSDNPDDLDVDAYAKYVFLTIDVRCVCAHDLSLGEHYILDYGNAKLGHILKTNPGLLKKGYQVITKAYSDRIKGIHFINLPTYATTLLTIANSVLSEKIQSRVFVHKDNESLHNVISRKLLPEEYGGSEKPLVELNKNWRKYIESHNDWFKLQETRKSNEALRPGQPMDSEMFGIDGSFRQLNVD